MTNIALRRELEQRIAKAAIKQLLRDGFSLGVNDGEETTIHHSTDAAAILKAMFTTDEDYLLVYIKGSGEDTDPQCDYWVRFVYGNDGWDVISDYSVALESHLTDADKIAQKYS